MIGGGTLLEASRADEELHTTALDAITYHEPADLIVTCEAGVTLAALQERLAHANQILPVWHPAPGRATVGGLVAHGWSGIGTQLYGALRDRVLEVKVVTGEAKVVRGGAKVVKNVTGFDLPRLLCGSRGTLGLITEVTLKVHPRPPAIYGVDRDGEDRAWLDELVGRAPQPIETVVQDGRSWAFAPGPLADAQALLGDGAREVSDDFEAVARAWREPEDDRPPSGLEIMRRIKQQFDPDGVFPEGGWYR